MYEALEQAKIGAANSSDLKLKKAVLHSLHDAFEEDGKMGQAGELLKNLGW